MLRMFVLIISFLFSSVSFAKPEIVVDHEGIEHVGGLAPLDSSFKDKARKKGLYAVQTDLLFDEELPSEYTPIGSLLGSIPNYSQGSYGTCYSFAGAYTIFLSEAINLSKINHGYEKAKELVDAYIKDKMFAPNVGIRACTDWGNGGWYFEMFDNWIEKGGALLKDVSYSGSGYRKCDFLDETIRGVEYKIIENSSEANIKRAVMKYGAVATAVASSCLSKKSTVGECSTSSYNHAVTIIGWTKTHWIIQNSWDSDTSNVFWYLNLKSNPYNNTYVVVKDHTDSIVPVPTPTPTPTPIKVDLKVFLIVLIGFLLSSIGLIISINRKG